MGPLLETFFNYTKDGRDDSPLKLLWKRISEEMWQCTQCICQHHQAQEMYASEYESSSVGPLLNVLQSLDEERVTQHLQEMNLRITKGEYDLMWDHPEVVSVMVEVVMHSCLPWRSGYCTDLCIFELTNMNHKFLSFYKSVDYNSLLDVVYKGNVTCFCGFMVTALFNLLVYISISLLHFVSNICLKIPSPLISRWIVRT